ncbi:MAG: hypothetical protein ACR2JB_12260 [Bryobacteraceae bacterium]
MQPSVSDLRASLHRVLVNKTRDSVSIQKYQIPRLESEGADFEERYWNRINSPVIGPTGEIEHIIHRVEDVIDYVQIKEAERAQRELARDLLQRETEARSRAELLNRIGPVLVSELDSDRLVQKVTDLATQLSGAEFGALFHTSSTSRANPTRFTLSPACPANSSLNFQCRGTRRCLGRPFAANLWSAATTLLWTLVTVTMHRTLECLRVTYP